MTRSRRFGLAAASLAVAIAALSGCSPDSTQPVEPTNSAVPTPEETTTTDSGTQATFALVTDYGNCDDGSRQVADMIATWPVQIVVTAGDNTQGTENCVPYDQSVGDYYGQYLDGADGARFFPVPGNHDYNNEGAGIDRYLDYFSYLGTMSDDPRYYSVSVANVNLFMIDSELTGAELEAQRTWLESSLTAAKDEAPFSWNVVVFHRPPYTSGPHEPNTAMRPDAGWDYKGWGADLVINGHQHVLEELNVDGLTYLVAGVGATGIARECPATIVPESSGCLAGIGALLITSTELTLTLDYRAPDGAGGTSAKKFTLIHEPSGE